MLILCHWMEGNIALVTMLKLKIVILELAQHRLMDPGQHGVHGIAVLQLVEEEHKIEQGPVITQHHQMVGPLVQVPQVNLKTVEWLLVLVRDNNM